MQGGVGADLCSPLATEDQLKRSSIQIDLKVNYLFDFY